jgi:hypothetical protein
VNVIFTNTVVRQRLSEPLFTWTTQQRKLTDRGWIECPFNPTINHDLPMDLWFFQQSFLLLGKFICHFILLSLSLNFKMKLSEKEKSPLTDHWSNICSYSNPRPSISFSYDLCQLSTFLSIEFMSLRSLSVTLLIYIQKCHCFCKRVSPFNQP